MKVKIINPAESKSLLADWGEFASICYNTKANKEKVGKHCLESQHFSGSRWRYIAFRIEDVPRDIIDQMIRHEQGVVKNVMSFRYTDQSNFSYYLPYGIEANSALKEKYSNYMAEAQSLYSDIKNVLISQGFEQENAIEQARNVLPMGTLTKADIGFTVEALIHLCHKRLCVRAEKPIRELTELIRNETLKILPELKEYLVPQCEYLLWCPEKKTCHKYPTKQELLKGNKNEN